MVDESTKKEQDAINWKKYYMKHSFDYLRHRLEKRIVMKHQVRLSTLKKYQLLSFYQKFATKANLKILKECIMQTCIKTCKIKIHYVK